MSINYAKAGNGARDAYQKWKATNPTNVSVTSFVAGYNAGRNKMKQTLKNIGIALLCAAFISFPFFYSLWAMKP